MDRPKGRTAVSAVCDGGVETGELDCCGGVQAESVRRLDGGSARVASSLRLRSFLTKKRLRREWKERISNQRKAGQSVR